MQGSLLTECTLPAVRVQGFTHPRFQWLQVWGPTGSYLRLVDSETLETIHEREVPKCTI